MQPKLPTFARPEVAAIRSTCNATPAGALRVLHLVGEPGSGRSTILEILAREAAASGAAVVATGGWPGQGSSRRSLPDLARSLGKLVSAEAAAALDAAVRDALRQATRNAPLFAPVTLDSLAATLAPLATELDQRPLHLFVDDAHLLEDVATRFLARLTQALPGAAPRTVVVATDGSRDPFAAEAMPGAEHLRLDPLERGALAALLEALGVPAEEAARGAEILHAGWLRTPHAARLYAELQHQEPTLVADAARAGLRGLYGRRFAELPEAERETLQIASVTLSGINFWRLERLGMGPREEVGRITDALRGRGILRASYPGGTLRLVFRDAEERLVAYGTIDDEKRRMLHASFARIVESDDLEPAERLSEAGRHLLLSGDELSGASRLLQAGRHLLDRGRLEEARRHFEEVERRGLRERALRLEALLAREGLADIESRMGNMEHSRGALEAIRREGQEVLDREALTRLTRKLASATLSIGRLDEAEALIQEGLAIQGEGGDGERARLHEQAARLEMRRGDLAAATGQIQRALVIAMRSKDERLLAIVRSCTAQVHQDRGDLQAAREELEAALAIHAALGDPGAYAPVANLLGTVLGELRLPDLATARYKEALHINEAQGNLTQAALVLNNLATEHMSAGELDEAEAYLERCIRIHERTGHREGSCIARVNLASIALQRYRAEDAIARATEAAHQAGALGHVLAETSAWTTRLSAELSLGRLADALQSLERVAGLARRNEQLMGQVWYATSHARLLMRLGEPERAEEILLDALHRAQEHGVAEPESTCLDLLAEVALLRGQYDRLRELLAVLENRKDETPSEASSRRALALEGACAEAAGIAPALEEEVTRFAASASAVDAARVRLALARRLPPKDALDTARAALEGYRSLGLVEESSEAAFVLGSVERALGMPEAQAHLEESARALLSVASELDDEHRDRYLGSYGRRRRLVPARRLE